MSTAEAQSSNTCVLRTARGQFAQLGRELPTELIEFGHAVIVHRLDLAQHLRLFFRVLDGVHFQLRERIFRFDSHLCEPQLAQLAAVP
eukprot:3259588-Prymnesium_polylepis.2